MRLYLVQHGESLSKDVDPERALSDAGRADAARLASFLAPRGLTIGRVLQSGKLRARQTAEILADKLTPDVALEETTGLNPLDDPAPLIRQVDESEQDTLVVGHLPFMGKLVARLVTGNEKPTVLTFQPGTMVCVERIEGTWTVAWMLRPELLRE